MCRMTFRQKKQSNVRNKGWNGSENVHGKQRQDGPALERGGGEVPQEAGGLRKPVEGWKGFPSYRLYFSL